MISRSLRCMTSTGRRDTTSTRSTRKSSRHSSSTPLPTMPVAPKMTTFMTWELSAISRARQNVRVRPACASVPLHVYEAITQSDDRLDLPAGGAEFRAQTPDVHVDGTRFDESIVPPDAFEQPIAGDHAIGVLRQVAEELEFTPGQPYVAAIDSHDHGIEVGEEVRPPIDERRYLA